MLSLTEEEFLTYVLPPSLHNDPLSDKNVFQIIYSYNNFNDEPLLGFQMACKYGHDDLAKIMLESLDCNNVHPLIYNRNCQGGYLYYACFYNKPELVKILRQMGCTNFKSGFKGASLGQNVDLAKEMLLAHKEQRDDFFERTRKIKSYSLERKYISEFFYKYACKANNKDIIKFVKSFDQMNWKDGFKGVCEGGHVKLAKKLLGKKELPSDSMFHAGSEDIVDFLNKRGHFSMNVLLDGACFRGDLPMSTLAIKKGANSWDNGLEIAVTQNHDSIIELMAEKGATDLSSAFNYACSIRNENLIETVLKKGFTDVQEGFDTLNSLKRTDLIERLKETYNVKYNGKPRVKI